MFDDDFIAELRENPLAMMERACERTLHYAIDDSSEHGRTASDNADEYLREFYALLRAVLKGDLLDINFNFPSAKDEASIDVGQKISLVSQIRERLAKQRTQIESEAMESKFSAALGSGFLIEFSQGDFDRIQVLLDELRKLVAESTLFEADHQRRLLARLEKLQAEMHKRVSDLDRFWGLIGDAGVAVGKFGKDAKPIFDRVREITGIVWNSQARAEELPSGTPPPMIEHDISVRDDRPIA